MQFSFICFLSYLYRLWTEHRLSYAFIKSLQPPNHSTTLTTTPQPFHYTHNMPRGTFVCPHNHVRNLISTSIIPVLPVSELYAPICMSQDCILLYHLYSCMFFLHILTYNNLMFFVSCPNLIIHVKFKFSFF